MAIMANANQGQLKFTASKSMKRFQIELRSVLSSVAQESHIFEITDTFFDQLDVARIHPVRKFSVVTNSAWKSPVNGSRPF